MTYHGTVQNGVIQLDAGVTLPDGVGVRVEVMNWAPSPTAPVEGVLPSLGQKLAALARKFEQLPSDLPEDLAANHDHYLHGLPKRP